MANQHAVDITELATLGEQFPLRLMQLGFRLMQVIDEHGRDQFRYVVPPVCEVQAGPFLMGSDQQQDPNAKEEEFPQHSVVLDTYEIACYPLTMAEYAYFAQATNRTTPDLQSSQHRPEHPMINVTWQDMRAYAEWLAQSTGDLWRLPTEAEWEKAARGTDGRIYPWGDTWDETRSNMRESGSEHMMPVGSYPAGVSPYGVHDLMANVREWTSTTYQPYPYQARDGREDLNKQARKVLRGGSWYITPPFARAASRGANDSVFIYYNIGDVGARLARGNGAS